MPGFKPQSPGRKVATIPLCSTDKMKIVLPCLKQAIFALEQGQRKVLGPTPAALNAQHNDVAFSSKLFPAKMMSVVGVTL